MRLLLPLVLFACDGDSNPIDTASLSEAGPPDVVVTPPDVDFGEVAAGSTEEVTIEVSNVGEASLEIRGLALEDPDTAYTLSAIGSVLVAGGETTTFTVTYTPETAIREPTNILLDTNDPDTPQVVIPLAGSGVAPVIDIQPAAIDLGEVYLGCASAQPFTIRNVGNADLLVTGLAFVSASAELGITDEEALVGSLPWTLTPGSATTVSVTHTPIDAFADEGSLSVASNDPVQPEAHVDVTAVGVAAGEMVETFEQNEDHGVDLLVALDASDDSMTADLARVSENLHALVEALAATAADWHLAVVMEDDGCVAGPRAYLDGSLTADELTDGLDAMLAGTPGEYTEKGFTLLENAMSAANLGAGGCNEGLVRTDARLALIGVTDEPEQSADGWAAYVARFQALKADPDDVVFYAVAGDYPSGCGDNGPAQHWYEASVATDGLYLSLCATDWSTHLDDLAEAEALLDSFELSRWPVAVTIEVRVDGVTQTEGWTYNAADRSLDFDAEHVPEAGAIIEVVYAVYGECEE